MSSVGVTVCEWWYSVWGGEMYTSGCFCRDATRTYFSDVCTVRLSSNYASRSSRTRDTDCVCVCVCVSVYSSNYSTVEMRRKLTASIGF